MYRLKEILMPDPEQGNQCIAIFYETVTRKFKNEGGNQKETGEFEVKNTHCELVPKSYITSVGLNKNSFVLRFHTNKKTPNLKLYFKDPETQIDKLAGLVEHTTGRGLIVKEHYANLTVDNQ